MMTIETIVDLAKGRGLKLKRVASTNGGEYAGPCPDCLGTDRGRYWPNHPDHAHKGGSYWCRRCNKSGDAIQFLRDFEGLSFHDACDRLGVDMDLPLRSRPQRGSRNTWSPEQRDNPGIAWQDKALELIGRAHQNQLKLNTRFYAERGLTAETVARHQLGINLADHYEIQTNWGLPEECAEGKLEVKKLCIPKGHIIPYIRDGKVLKLRIRRTVHDDDQPRYNLVRGSTACTSVYGEEPGRDKVVLVVESELDAILLDQEAGDLVTTTAMGSAQTKPDDYAHKILTNAPLILVALDMDDAGNRAAQWWPPIYPQAERVLIPGDKKDPGEYRQQGGDLRNWIQTCLPEHMAKVEQRPDYEKRNCLGGISCPFILEEGLDGERGFCCEYEDGKLVLDIMKCPLGHWVKTPDGRLADTV